MQLRTITARYGRKRQPAQYESAEAMIEFTLSVDEDGQIGNLDIEHMNIGQTLLGQAKTLVLTELGVVRPGESASAHDHVVQTETTGKDAASAQADAGGKGGRRKRGEAQKPPASTGGAASAAPSTETNGATPPANNGAAIPLDDGAQKPAAETAKPAGETALGRTLPAGNEKPADNGAANGIPLGETASVSQATPQQTITAANGAQVTPAEVQKYMTQCLVAKKFLPAVALGLLKNEYKVERVYDLNPEQLSALWKKLHEMAGEPLPA